MIETYPNHDKIRSYDPKRHHPAWQNLNRECITFNTNLTNTNFMKIGVTPTRGWGPGKGVHQSMVARPGRIVAVNVRAKIAGVPGIGSMDLLLFNQNLSPPVLQYIFPAPYIAGTVVYHWVTGLSYPIDPVTRNIVSLVMSSGSPPGDFTDVIGQVWVEYDP